MRLIRTLRNAFRYLFLSVLSAKPILVEIGNAKQNRNEYIDAFGDCFRGIYRRDSRSPAEKMSHENDSYPDMPGYHIQVDIRKRLVTVYDPLTREEYKDVREQLERALRESRDSLFVPNRRFTPCKDRISRNCTDEYLSRCIKQLYRLCQSGNAQLKSGRFPKSLIKAAAAERSRDALEQWGPQIPIPSACR